jgi:hypothetical protein
VEYVDIHTWYILYMSRSSEFHHCATRNSSGYTQYTRSYLLLSSNWKTLLFLYFFLIKFIFSILSCYYFLRICFLQRLLPKFANRSWYARTDLHVKPKNWSISGPVCLSAVCKWGYGLGGCVSVNVSVGVKFTLCTHQPTLNWELQIRPELAVLVRNSAS